MKPIPLFIILITAAALASCAPVTKRPPAPDPEQELQQRRLSELERRLQMQHTTNDHWQTLAASLGVGCVVLLILGTALGTKTRHDALTPS